jgi:predicted RND superfamily exporter protein
VRRTLTQTGGALAGSALTTAIGFGVLVTSTLTPFEQLGYVIVYAIASSLMAAVLVLPSLLVLWDRQDRRRHGDPASRATDATPASTPPPVPAR